MYFNVDFLTTLLSIDYQKHQKQRSILKADPLEGKKLVVYIILVTIITLYIILFSFDGKAEIISIVKTGKILQIIGLSIGGVIILWYFGYLIGIVLLIPTGILYYSGLWIYKKIFCGKKYEIKEREFKEFETRVDALISGYIEVDHKLLVNKIAQSNEYGEFANLRKEYIDNYSFISNAHGVLRNSMIFSRHRVEDHLEKSKEIIRIISTIRQDYFSQVETSGSLGINYGSAKLNPFSGDLNSKIETILRDLYKNVEPPSIPQTRGIIQRIKERTTPISSRQEAVGKVIKRPRFRRAARVQRTVDLNPIKVNWTDILQKKQNIGEVGEAIVFNHEIEKLIELDLEILIPSIEHTSIINGDGAGYDIKSFNEEGEEIFIEVKSTEGSKNNPIYFSKNELITMKTAQDKYHLYRVYNLDISSRTGSISIFPGYKCVCDNFDFSTETVRAKLKNS